MSRVVVIGGGHGLACTLRATSSYASHVAAVVTTADDGGSTGRLRAAWDVPAPGDVRRCLSALADPNLVWSRLLERRFDAGELDGHAVGNLLLLALTEELGRFHLAVDQLAALVGVTADRARVVPVAEDPVVLAARAAGRRVEGQVAVAAAEGLEEVWVEPRGTTCSPDAVAAVRAADQIVLGPGSLYTSVLAAAVVGDLRRHLAESDARIVYVCNLHAETAETRGYDVGAHVGALVAHGVLPDVVITQPGTLPLGSPGCAVVEADVAAEGGRAHDAAKLGAALSKVL